MEQQIFDAINNLTIAVINKTDPSIYAAIITVVGMLGTAICTALIQFRITKKVINSDYNKMMKQLVIENKFKERQDWKNNLRIIISNLLSETDPESNSKPNKFKVNSLVHQVQLLLNTNDIYERELNNTINQFILLVNGWTGEIDPVQLLKLHSAVSEQTKFILNKSIGQ